MNGEAAAPSAADKPKYTEAQRHELIEQQMKALESGSVQPEFSLKQPDIVVDGNANTFQKYYERFLNHELSPEELEKYNGDWLQALKAKDNANKPDFIEGDGHRLRRKGLALMNARNRTDLGNAERLVDQYHTEIRYCHQFLSWYIWNYSEGRWKKDQTGFIFRIAKDVVRRIKDESNQFPEGDVRRRDFFNWMMTCENRSHIKGMVELAQNEKPVVVIPDDLDKDDYLFNLRNGTFNLKTFELQNHDKRLNITRLANYDYDERADCPIFKKYLDRTFQSNPKKKEIITYLQRAAGYTLTGSTAEQCLFLLYGSGANGKSVLINIIKAMMDEYGTVAQSKTFTTDSKQDIRNDLAALAGCRFVCSSENSSDTKLDEGLVKEITGGDEIKARFLHQEYFTFNPKFKLWWCFNHPPTITDMTVSIWRRIKIIPFTETIPETEWNKRLADEIIEKELPGVFNWAVEGLREYYKNGLQEPVEVTKATKTYKDDQDVLAEFFKSSCEITESELDRVQANVLYKTYSTWWYSMEEPTKPLSSTKFGRLCRDRGMKKVENREGTFYTNIKIKKMVNW